MNLRHRSKRAGLSLLEVLTALAIFMFSVVVISQMVDRGSQTALRSQKMTKAAILAESKMAEVMAGIQPLQSTGQQAFDGDEEPGWYFSIITEPQSWSNVTIENQGVIGLSNVHISVVYSGSRMLGEVEYSLSRLVLDPRLRVPMPTPTPPATAQTGGTGTGATGGGGGGGGAGGGGGGGGGGRPGGGGGGRPGGGGGGSGGRP